MITHRTRNEADLTPLEVRIPCAAVTLEGTLAFPPGAKGVVVFAHGSGSSRYSPRNQFVARVLRESGSGSMPWYHAADGPISRVMRWRVCSRRRCSSWVDTMTW